MLRLLFFSVILSLLSGCAAMKQQERQQKFSALYHKAQYQQAAEFQLESKNSQTNDPEDLLITLQAATALRYADDITQSNLLFDQAENILKQHHQKILLNKSVSTLSSILVNDAVLDYSGTSYDGIMLNTYKALNFWQSGNKAYARVEFNRALDRQRRAKALFKAEIKQQQQAISKKGGNYARNTNNPKVTQLVKRAYSNLYNFQAYPDFVNPFSTYLAGLFYLHDGDYAKAVDVLKEAHGMLPTQAIVEADFKLAQALQQGEPDPQKYAWIIFENGSAPLKTEFRIDLPLFILSRNAFYTGIALPKLVLQKNAHPFLNINTLDESSRTQPLASMDNVIQTDFKKRYPWIVSRALISAIAKTTAQYIAQKQLGPWGGLAASLLQLATTSADIRIWSALPKEFQIAKIKLPSDNLIRISVPNKAATHIKLEANKNQLIYIKIPKSYSPITYNSFVL